MQLKVWMLANGVSVKQFADQIDVHRAMIYRYFEGIMPRSKVIRRIAEFTKNSVTVQDFYENSLAHDDGPASSPIAMVAVVASTPQPATVATPPAKPVVVPSTTLNVALAAIRSFKAGRPHPAPEPLPDPEQLLQHIISQTTPR